MAALTDLNTMEIYLLRHGIAEESAVGGRDSDRALTAEGRDKLRRVLKRAHAGGVRPGVILASPYKRAMETAQMAAETLEYRGEIVKTQGAGSLTRLPRRHGMRSARGAMRTRYCWPVTSR